MHGDLAARNVLLTTDKVAKISDFGLSRVVIDSGNYMKKTQVSLFKLRMEFTSYILVIEAQYWV